MVTMKKTRLTEDLLPGGRGDNTDPATLDQDQLAVGSLVQKQHTSNSTIAAQIAIDHLVEHPDYYTKLIKAGLVDEPSAIALAKKLGILEPKKAQPKKQQPKQKPEPKKQPEKPKKKQEPVKQEQLRQTTRKQVMQDITLLIYRQMKQDKHKLAQSWKNVMAMYKGHKFSEAERKNIAGKLRQIIVANQPSRLVQVIEGLDAAKQLDQLL